MYQKKNKDDDGEVTKRNNIFRLYKHKKKKKYQYIYELNFLIISEKILKEK